LTAGITGFVISMVLTLCLGWPVTATAQEKPQLFQQGQEIFNSGCADCHRGNGEGLPDVFPALKGNILVLGDPEAVIQTILDGRKGKIGTMPPHKAKLTDPQIAAVVTFIRNNWGNQGAAVMPETVAKIRKK
jgi:mono/diheme cytochrome c family protein